MTERQLQGATWLGSIVFIFAGWLIAGRIGAGVALAILSALCLGGVHYESTKRKSSDGGGM